MSEASAPGRVGAGGLKRAALAATALASMAAVAASLLPWYGVSITGYDFSETFNAWHGYSSVAVLMALVVIPLSATAFGLARSEPGVTVGITLVTAVLAAAALAVEVGRIATLTTDAGDDPSIGGVDIGFRWGAWVLVAAMSIAVVASIVAVVAQPRTPPPRPQPVPPEPPPYGFVPPPATTSGLAIVALVLAFVFAPAAIVVGHVALNQIRRTGQSGDGLAWAGLILGYVFTALALAAIVAGLVAGAHDPG
ncbi:MAG: DUF4190 domain-containing protein [Frankiaceae bacterium]|nr:DUF4190 domain-containing protein [Frankiaceae bacterium]